MTFAQQLPDVMIRDTPFSYACGRCSRCCYCKGISLNPYEVLRLARNQGLTTTEFVRRFTDTAGTQLKQRDDGACIFLTPQGCGVHADRPLVCRIYPLGRHISPEDDETFSRFSSPHPNSEGKYGSDGTVGDYLETQGAELFIEAADLYVNLFREMAGLLSEQADCLTPSDREMVSEHCVFPEVDSDEYPVWLDVDRVVEQYCCERDFAKPGEPWRLMELHLEALSTWSNDLAKESL